MLYNKSDAPPPADKLRVTCRDFTADPVTEHVESFVTSAATWLTKLPEEARVLLKAPESSTAPGKPLLAEFPFGKGKVVWIGDGWFLRPLNLELGGNAQLLLNIVNRLAGRPVARLTQAELDSALFITAAKLEQAEQDEKAGRTVFDRPSPLRFIRATTPGK